MLLGHHGIVAALSQLVTMKDEDGKVSEPSAVQTTCTEKATQTHGFVGDEKLEVIFLPLGYLHMTLDVVQMTANTR